MTDPSSVHDLPKFSGVDTTCPKCATEQSSHPSYQSRVQTTGLREEWLARYCSTCSYRWNEQVVQPKTSNGSGGGAPPVDFLDVAKKFLSDDAIGKFVSALLKEKM